MDSRSYDRYLRSFLGVTSAVATILVGLGSIVTWCDEAGDLRERLWSEH